MIDKWDTETFGELTEENMRAVMKGRSCYINRYVYSPGTYFPPHTHSVDKIDGVLSGEFKMTMNGKEVILKAGDMLFVPAGEVHSAEVMGNRPVVSLDGIIE
ncbi:MAG: cupin domain-containing protein [Spirochaetia bacterium]|nr:cupin domain-containing protein [Spirochaetia bacterium]